MGIGGRPLAWLVWLGLSLLCFAPATLRAEPDDPFSRSYSLLDPPWLAVRALTIETTQDVLAGDQSSAQTGILGPLVGRTDPALDLPAGLEAKPLLPSPASGVRLSPSEGSGLLMFQGLLIVGLYRGRRRWTAALLALLALTRSGISAVTEMIGLPKAPDARSTTSAHPGAPMETHHPVRSPSLQRTYAGLLRRLAAEPAPAADDAAVCMIERRPATHIASAKRVAGSLVPALLLCPEAKVPPSPFTALYPSQGRDLLPSQFIPFSLFARPPP